MVFSTNQSKHFYVTTGLGTVTETSAVGTLEAVTPAGTNKLYFKYMSPGGQVRTDLIDLDKVQYAKYTTPAQMRRKLKAVSIELDPNVSEEAIVGQDYIVNINFKNYFGPSDLHTYLKQGVARAFDSDKNKLFARLAISLAKNFAREIVKPIRIILVGADSNVEVTEKTKLSELTGEYRRIDLEELPQPWTLGVEEATPVNFEVSFVPITVDGSERIWGIVDNEIATNTVPANPAMGVIEAGVIGNGQKIADMEYFYMKERGDQYGNIGWPDVVKTTYLVDPSKEYSVIDIHYSYVGHNESVQMSEKDITIVGNSDVIYSLKENLSNKLQFAE